MSGDECSFLFCEIHSCIACRDLEALFLAPSSSLLAVRSVDSVTRSRLIFICENPSNRRPQRSIRDQMKRILHSSRVSGSPRLCVKNSTPPLSTFHSPLSSQSCNRLRTRTSFAWSKYGCHSTSGFSSRRQLRTFCRVFKAMCGH